MLGFDVLDQKLDIHKSRFLEASAGCGKTFAISHLVVRLLLSGVKINQILVVTFTKAAASELKSRIKTAIRQAYDQLVLNSADLDYLRAQQNDADKKNTAKSCLLSALSNFDDAKIFTIHGFCFQTLRDFALQTKLSLDHLEENGSPGAIKQMIKDFLRTGLSHNDVSVNQFDLLLRWHRNQFENLISDFVKIAVHRIPVFRTYSYAEVCEKIQHAINKIKKDFNVDKELLYEDLCQAALQYRNVNDRHKNIKSEFLEAFHNLCACFDGLVVDFTGSPIVQLTEENKLKKSPNVFFHYPGLIETLQKSLFVWIKYLSDPLMIFAHIAEKIRLHIERILDEEELLFFDDLIHLMKKNVQEESFADCLRETYRAVLIDEFQDTDSAQWEIFSKLFAADYKGCVYLIGDPKQSIYRFRNADIYTYLNARERLEVAPLNCNYRSEPALVDALNTLFADQALFAMPRKGDYLPCPPVRAGKKPCKTFSDNKKNCHFFSGSNENELFLFIAKEIHHLINHEGISISECAVLVKDRYQAFRFKRICDQFRIPAVCSRSHAISDSLARQILQELVEALLNLKDDSIVLRVLAGPFFCMTHRTLNAGYESALPILHSYATLFENKHMFASFMEIFSDRGEMILLQQDGDAIYHDLIHLVELGCQTCQTLDQFLTFLKELSLEDPDSERGRYPLEDGVPILTIHASKGLEFDIVFPIGLILASPLERELILSCDSSEWVPSDHENEHYEKEMEAERMRQLYVAMTRARLRLYIPYIDSSQESETEKKRVVQSPLSAFLGERRLSEIIAKTDLFSHSSRKELLEHNDAEPHRDLLIQPKKPVFDFANKKIYSFTSTSALHIETKNIVPGDDELPAGIETGVLLHQILETIPLHRYPDQEAVRSQIAPFLRTHPLQIFENRIAEMIYFALHRPLPAPDGPFSLAQVDACRMKREMAFLFPTELGFCKGFVDLFFEYGGKYYFLDWKSNFLGSSRENYVPEQLQIVMNSFNYNNQAALYKEAVERYLDLFGKRKAFGGFFYLFLRGIIFDDTTGIFFSN